MFLAAWRMEVNGSRCNSILYVEENLIYLFPARGLAYLPPAPKGEWHAG